MVAMQALATAETDYRQTSQLALSDSRSKTQLALLVGKVEERRSEIDYLQEQLTRARVLAPQAGLVLMDDPSEWIGKPVATGERILRLAALDDVEVEAWLPIADAIRLSSGDEVSLYLSASPLSPVSATLRYMAHDAVQRPDGSFAYRVRATRAFQPVHASRADCVCLGHLAVPLGAVLGYCGLGVCVFLQAARRDFVCRRNCVVRAVAHPR